VFKKLILLMFLNKVLVLPYIYFNWNFYKFSMSLKQFLKPDWKKIAIFIIIILPSIVVEACVNNLLSCQLISAPFGYILVLFTLFVFPIFLLFKVIGIPYQVFLPWVLVLVINLLYEYLLSCLIVWIYDKFRNKKAKKK
jgi:hypothetical protein